MSVGEITNGASTGYAVVQGEHGSWFTQARYGLFLHWGLYSMLGRGEWVRNRERIPDEVYLALPEKFSAPEFDPKAWASMAVASGMRYAVLTTKHHDGFCLWDSKTCDFNSMRSAMRRDVVGEFVEAFREAGLKVGLYYSLGDWHHPDWRRAVKGDDAARLRFLGYTRGLLDELMTQYGPIDVLWYDLPQGLTAEEWNAEVMNARVRSQQPGILINNRSMLPEDFSVREQSLHGAPLGRMWESCLTLTESWAYVESDQEYKTPRQVAKALAKVVAGGGNLLLNVGPDGQGAIPIASQTVLREVGAWLNRVGESIYGASGVGIPFNLWGASTAVENRMYLFLERYFGPELVIGGLLPNVLRAQVLGTDHRLTVERQGSQTFVRGLPISQPDPLLTVLRLDLDGKPEQDTSRVIGGADIMASFPD